MAVLEVRVEGGRTKVFVSLSARRKRASSQQADSLAPVEDGGRPQQRVDIEVSRRRWTEDHLGHPLGGVALHRRRDVGVDLPRDVGAGVVQALADDLDVDAAVSASVAQVWRRPWRVIARERGVGVVPVELRLLAVELSGEALRVVQRAVRLAEHVALVVVAGPDAELRPRPARSCSRRSIATVPESRRTMWPRLVFGSSLTTISWSIAVTCREITAVPASRSRSSHRRPRHSPRRHPVVARKIHAGR